VKAKSSDVLSINGGTIRMKTESDTTDLEVIKTNAEKGKSQVQLGVATIDVLSAILINRSSTT
jgi:hypothetical protein